MQPAADAAERRAENARKAREKAAALFPGETWGEYAPGICVAESRAPKSAEQARTLEKELAQARILAAGGHAVCLLPERGPRGAKHPDAVVDGLVMEFKTVTGNERKIRENFKNARKQAENVFLKIDADFSQEFVLGKLIGAVRRGNYSGGITIAHFTRAGKTYYWNTDAMR